MKDLTKFYRQITTLFIGLLVSISSAAIADEVEEVVVKGNVLYSDQVQALKTPVPILDVPQTLSIVTDEDIRKQGIREIGDIVRYTPGVNTSQGEGHRDAVVFRGVRSTADFYQDGVRDDVQYYRSLYNVDQVEILRGPNALLFGRGGTGGIINRVTKKAVIGEQFGSFDLGADDFGSTDLALDYNIQSSENSALRINVHVDALENHRDFYDGDRVGFNPTLRVALSEDTILDLSYENADHERMIDRGIPTANGVPVKSLKSIVFGTSDLNITTLEADIFRGSLTHNFSETSKGIFSITSSEFEKLYQNLYASGYNATTNVVTLDGYRDPTERENLIISGNLINEVQIGSTTHTILIGAEMIDTDNKNHRYDSYWSTTQKDKESFNVSRPLNIGVNSAGVSTGVNFNTKLKSKTTSDIEVTSFYIQDQIDVSDNLKLMLGGRIDQFDITVDDIKSGTSQSRNDDEFSPRAGVIFKPQDNVSVYYSYSESFLPRSGEQFKKLTASSAALDPDVYENSEIGVNWDITPDLSLRASYFDSEQTVATRDESGEGAEIVGLRVDGVELELKGQVNDQLYVQFGYSKMDGKTSSGGEPREIPEHTVSLWTTYQVSDKFGYGIGFTRQGESNISNNKPGLVLPDYTRVDFAAYYEISEGTSIQLNIENLGDRLYFPHSHSTHQASVGEPLNARVSIRRNF
ncbi:MAG: TonB-dependent siderophore receptor [Gammaproteobacteria bacterium]|nr:TonB-dependent siderophore receptor [Gammaproteobacteria bacterium]|tara:strand:- start:2107 stop:4185 length:2079 start_codon:yes stop_codon:yes gene_type:complete